MVEGERKRLLSVPGAGDSSRRKANLFELELYFLGEFCLSRSAAEKGLTFIVGRWGCGKKKKESKNYTLVEEAAQTSVMAGSRYETGLLHGRREYGVRVYNATQCWMVNK